MNIDVKALADLLKVQDESDSEDEEVSKKVSALSHKVGYILNSGNCAPLHDFVNDLLGQNSL